MSDITPLTEREETQRYAWRSGDRMNDLRIALKSLTTVRLCVNTVSYTHLTLPTIYSV